MKLPLHRAIVAAVFVLISVAIFLIFWQSDGITDRNWPLAFVIIVTALSPIVVSLVNLESRTRTVMYWVIAVMMIWPAAIGVFAGWGLLLVIGIVVLLYGAWMENEGRWR